MANKYWELFLIAKGKYKSQAARAGYPHTFFSSLRHNTTHTPVIDGLEKKLKACEDDQKAHILIRNHFKQHNKFNNHSFNTYFLDELLKNFLDEDWQDFNPKPLVLYQGTLYRGSAAPPDIVFKKGFKENSSSLKLDDYTSDCNGYIGVSASKSFALAKMYALPQINQHSFEDYDTDYSKTGFVYEINYRGSEGIDLQPTLKKRNCNFRALLAGGKSEVNIIGKILPEDIVCAYQVERNSKNLIKIVNPKYLSERKKVSNDSRLIVTGRDFSESKMDNEIKKKIKR